QRGALDGPAGYVDLMNALVADVAVAEIPEPVPVVMDEVGVVRLLRGRAQPEVEIHLGRRIAVGPSADAAARLVAQAARHEQPAIAARADVLDRVDHGTAARLRAVLDDDVVPARRRDGDATFLDVVAGRLFDIDVLAGLSRPDGHQRVPVIRRRDRDGV